MSDADRRPVALRRVRPTDRTWIAVLERAGYYCEWQELGQRCGLRDGDIDSIGGGRVRLTPDHRTPHSLDPSIDPDDPTQWQALCGRHQVIKRNYWDSVTGKLNTYAIVQAATQNEKREIFAFLLEYFGYHLRNDGRIE
jgi:hypothetical protein